MYKKKLPSISEGSLSVNAVKVLTATTTQLENIINQNSHKKHSSSKNKTLPKITKGGKSKKRKTGSKKRKTRKMFFFF